MMLEAIGVAATVGICIGVWVTLGFLIRNRG